MRITSSNKIYRAYKLELHHCRISNSSMNSIGRVRSVIPETCSEEGLVCKTRYCHFTFICCLMPWIASLFVWKRQLRIYKVIIHFFPVIFPEQPKLQVGNCKRMSANITVLYNYTVWMFGYHVCALIINKYDAILIWAISIYIAT